METNPPTVLMRSRSKVLSWWLINTTMIIAAISAAVGGFALAASGIALAASGTGLKIPNAWIIWPWCILSVIALSLCTVGLVGLLMPNGATLQINTEGFVCRTTFNTKSYRWTDVFGFKVARVWLHRCVVFDYTPKYHAGAGRTIPKPFSGHEGMIPDFFTVSRQEVAELLNRHQQHSVLTDEEVAQESG